jgi:hypothetical protein
MQLPLLYSAWEQMLILNDASRSTEGGYVEREALCLTGYGIRES